MKERERPTDVGTGEGTQKSGMEAVDEEQDGMTFEALTGVRRPGAAPAEKADATAARAAAVNGEALRRVRERRLSEAEEQTAFFRWIEWARHLAPELDLFFHVPNGGSRNKVEAGRLKAQGVRAGVPDLCLPVARGGFHGLFIELKVDGGRPSAAQKEWLRLLAAQGYRAEICVGWLAAARTACDYLQLDAARLGVV